MLDSLRRNSRGILLMLGSATLAAVGQLCWKLGADGDWLMVGLGLVLYALGALVMVVAYRFGSMSVLQPVLAVGYALSLVLGATVLDEAVGTWRVIGVVVIIVGVVLIALGDGGEPGAE